MLRSLSASLQRARSSISSISTIRNEVLAELPSAGRGLALRCDVSDVTQIRAAFSSLERLDVLVNCAG